MYQREYIPILKMQQKIPYVVIPVIISCIFYYYKKIYHKSNGRKLIILDMNGVIVDRKNKKSFKLEDSEKLPNNTSGTCFIWKRPYTGIFIDYIFKNFDVAVWSAAKKHNVQNMVDFIFEDRQKELIFIWDQSKCISEFRENSTHPIFLKPINEVLKYFPVYKNNIIFIDDSPEKLKYNEKFTSICPSTWEYTRIDDNIMDNDGKLTTYLKNMICCKSSNVQEYVKNNPY